MKNTSKSLNVGYNRASRSDELLSDVCIYAFHAQIARNVAKIRKEKGFSQLDLALSIGHKSVSLVSGAESGYKKIHFNLEQLYRIAHALEVPITDFFEGVEQIDNAESYE